LEQVNIAEKIYQNIHDIFAKKSSVVSGLQVLGTFERYQKDTAFQIQINNFVARTHKLCNKCNALLKERQDGTELKVTQLLPSSTLHTVDSTNTPKYPEQRPVETKMSNKIAKAANNKK
jgi:hypothetical protein